MREFKFRAWDKEKNEILPVKLMDFSQWWVSCDPHYGTSKPNEYGERNSFKNEETDRHIIMQYTGLKDKNGTEIYEGDIIDGSWINPMSKEKVMRHYQVTFNKGKYNAELIGHHPYGSTMLYFENDKSEVIGNIYENPELLEDNHE